MGHHSPVADEDESLPTGRGRVLFLALVTVTAFAPAVSYLVPSPWNKGLLAMAMLCAVTALCVLLGPDLWRNAVRDFESRRKSR